MKITEDVLEVLSNAVVVGNTLKLAGQLDRTLYTRTDKVLKAAGGVWKRGQSAHVFPQDAEETIDQIILTGEITTNQDMGYFPTPAIVVAQLIDLAELEPNMDVLEPSAGNGAIAYEVGKLANVDCIEIDQNRYCSLATGDGLICSVQCGDFLSIEPTKLYDRVIMNPPFAKRADVKHVNHALRFLKPNGVLVSIMSAGTLFRQDNLTREFRERVESSGGSIERLPDGSFKESGTMVGTVIVKIYT